MRTSDCLPHQVLETKRTLDGGLRAAISLEMQPRVRHGWMTLIMTDGKEQVTYVTPQPPLELPPVTSKAAPCWAPAGAPCWAPAGAPAGAPAEGEARGEEPPALVASGKGGVAFVF
jgi:hypothetical protein